MGVSKNRLLFNNVLSCRCSRDTIPLRRHNPVQERPQHSPSAFSRVLTRSAAIARHLYSHQHASLHNKLRKYWYLLEITSDSRSTHVSEERRCATTSARFSREYTLWSEHQVVYT